MFKFIRKFIIKELETKTRLNFFKRMAMIFQGFFSDSFYIYNQFADYERNKYLTDLQRIKTKEINKPYHLILNNKLIFERVMGNYITIPKCIASIDEGVIVSLIEKKIDKIDSLIEYCKEKGKLVFKPVDGGGGSGIKILEIINGNLSLNKQDITNEEFKSFLRKLKNYMITEFVIQAKYASDIFPYSTNTIRIITMLDQVAQGPFIPIAVHRIGTFKSQPVDNWTQGGLSALVDLETGEIGQGATYEKGSLIWHDDHPDTGAKIKGIKIPYWTQIKESVLKAAKSMPYLKYIGWDVVVTDRGFMIIEGNNYSDVNLLQIHRPLLIDQRVVDFYAYHRII